MNLLSLLEKLANHTHHSIAVDEAIKSQSNDIQSAFHANDGHALKQKLGCTTYLADKSLVVQIKYS